MNVELGKTYRDKITEFEGVATGKVEYITGCNQVLLQPKVMNGSWQESHWIDVDRIEESGSDRATIGFTSPGSDKDAPRR